MTVALAADPGPALGGYPPHAVTAPSPARTGPLGSIAQYRWYRDHARLALRSRDHSYAEGFADGWRIFGHPTRSAQ